MFVRWPLVIDPNNNNNNSNEKIKNREKLIKDPAPVPYIQILQNVLINVSYFMFFFSHME